MLYDIFSMSVIVCYIDPAHGLIQRLSLPYQFLTAAVADLIFVEAGIFSLALMMRTWHSPFEELFSCWDSLATVSMEGGL